VRRKTSDDRTASTHERGPRHDRAMHCKLGAGSGCGVPARIAHRQQAGQRGAAARDDIDSVLTVWYRFPQARCLFVATVREDVAAVRRSAEEDGEMTATTAITSTAHGIPGSPECRRRCSRCRANRTACCRRAGSTGRAEDERQAARDLHHRERGDERRQPKAPPLRVIQPAPQPIARPTPSVTRNVPGPPRCSVLATMPSHADIADSEPTTDRFRP